MNPHDIRFYSLMPNFRSRTKAETALTRHWGLTPPPPSPINFVHVVVFMEILEVMLVGLKKKEGFR